MFFNDVKIEPGELLRKQRSALGLTNADEFRLICHNRQIAESVTSDRYNQLHSGVPVEGAEFTEHLRDGNVIIAHGNIVEFSTRQSSYTLFTEEGAIEIAIESVDADRFGWESLPGNPQLITVDTSEMPSHDPTAELIFAPKIRGSKGYQDHYLCWKVRVDVLAPTPDVVNVYINAKTGQVEEMVSEVRTHSSPADLDYGYGRQRIDDRTRIPFIGHLYRYLRALEEGNIETRRSEGRNITFGKLSDVRIRNGDFEGDGWPIDFAPETTAHWVVTRSYNYFREVHDFDGWNGGGQKAKVISQAEVGQLSYVDNTIRFGFGPSWTGHGATLDIGGHEFTHGIIDDLDALEYAREPGALNESFADIFGVLVERFVDVGPFDWEVGEDAFTPIALRNMVNPAVGLIPQPAVYEGANWLFPTTEPPSPANDNHGVHINSGVQNRWFSILAAGGTQNGVRVRAIGVDDAARIAFYNMTNFMQRTSQFADAREGAIGAAEILFGECSFEAEQTTNAWAAVGVGAPAINGCIEITGPISLCGDQPIGNLTYTAQVPRGTNVRWTTPAGWGIRVNGIGNNRLTVTNIPGYPSSTSNAFTITATTDQGATISVLLRMRPCLPDCPPGEPLCLREGEDEPTTEVGRSLQKNVSPEENNLTVFPNPATTSIKLGGDLVAIEQLTILNAFGQAVVSVDGSLLSRQIDIGRLSAGTYFLRIESLEGSPQKLIRFVKY